jgi:hypothetical protein
MESFIKNSKLGWLGFGSEREHPVREYYTKGGSITVLLTSCLTGVD